jgi:hypothetical protein
VLYLQTIWTGQGPGLVTSHYTIDQSPDSGSEWAGNQAPDIKCAHLRIDVTCRARVVERVVELCSLCLAWDGGTRLGENSEEDFVIYALLLFRNHC